MKIAIASGKGGTRHFGVPTCICINKWDLNHDMTKQIMAQAQDWGLATVGRVRYDPAVTRAQLEALSLVEYADNGAASDVRALWKEISCHLKAAPQKPMPNRGAALQSTVAPRSAP